MHAMVHRWHAMVSHDLAIVQFKSCNLNRVLEADEFVASGAGYTQGRFRTLELQGLNSVNQVIYKGLCIHFSSEWSADSSILFFVFAARVFPHRLMFIGGPPEKRENRGNIICPKGVNREKYRYFFLFF